MQNQGTVWTEKSEIPGYFYSGIWNIALEWDTFKKNKQSFLDFKPVFQKGC